jgi:hypothetical protein
VRRTGQIMGHLKHWHVPSKTKRDTTMGSCGASVSRTLRDPYAFLTGDGGFYGAGREVGSTRDTC